VRLSAIGVPNGFLQTLSGGQGRGEAKQETKSEPKTTVSACPAVPEAPPRVSINDNIETAIRHRPIGIVTACADAKWFKSQVDYGGPWDYKSLGSDSKKYAPFGNFNYGATGAAIGFRENTLLRMAGWAQQRNKDEMGAGDGGDPGSQFSIIIDMLLGREGGTPPYGDFKEDQELIKQGIQYFKQGCHKRK
jgi:hypothetical protein